LIVCEGKVTEPYYFDDLRVLVRSVIDLKLEPAGAPKKVVERAVELKREAERLARRSRDLNDRYDEVWCVFDVDEHPLLAEAKQQALANGLDVAISNPCFELWVLLHFQDQSAHIERDRVQSLCRHYMPGYEKKLPCSILAPLLDEAVGRALRLAAWHETRGTTGENPSTGVHLLVERIRAEAN
jgi:hypothetical protein